MSDQFGQLICPFFSFTNSIVALCPTEKSIGQTKSSLVLIPNRRYYLNMNRPNIKAKKCSSEKEIDDAKLVRYQVFVVEQGIDQLIENQDDDQCDHFVVYLGEKPVGAGRVRYLNDDFAKIERMSVIKEARGQGAGSMAFLAMMEHLEKKKIPQITLDAQCHAKGFYEKFGFMPEGGIFDEVGIPHIKMIKRL